MFTSDNGFFHGEHRVPTGKVLLYEPSMRVPLIMRGPGIPRGALRHELVANIDLAPTILAAGAGPAGRHGRAPAAAVRARRAAQSGTRHPARDAELQGAPFAALRLRRALPGEQELYDLAADPNQLTSLHASAAHAPLKADLAADSRSSGRARAAYVVGRPTRARVRYDVDSKGGLCARGPSPGRRGRRRRRAILTASLLRGTAGSSATAGRRSAR